MLAKNFARLLKEPVSLRQDRRRVIQATVPAPRFRFRERKPPPLLPPFVAVARAFLGAIFFFHDFFARGNRRPGPVIFFFFFFKILISLLFNLPPPSFFIACFPPTPNAGAGVGFVFSVCASGFWRIFKNAPVLRA